MRVKSIWINSAKEQQEIELKEYESIEEAIRVLGPEKVLKHINYVEQLTQRSEVRKKMK